MSNDTNLRVVREHAMQYNYLVTALVGSAVNSSIKEIKVEYTVLAWDPMEAGKKIVDHLNMDVKHFRIESILEVDEEEADTEYDDSEYQE